MNNKQIFGLILILLFAFLLTLSSRNQTREIRTNLPINNPPQDIKDKFKIVTAFNVISHVIPHALKVYESDNRFYPTTEQGLNALVTKPTIEPIPPQWKSSYFNSNLLQDPWQNNYTYHNTDQVIKITSLGADGQENTEDDLIVEFPIKDYQSISIDPEKLPALSDQIRTIIEPTIPLETVEIKQNGEFILKGKIERTHDFYNKKLDTLGIVLRNNLLFKYTAIVENMIPPNAIDFQISGVFVGDLENETQISEGFNHLNYYLNSRCMTFEGFMNPDDSECNFKPQNIDHLFHQKGKKVTITWECPENQEAIYFYWFCCSCEDNTSHSIPVVQSQYTLTIDPNHEYAYAISCRDKTGLLDCSSPLRAVQSPAYNLTSMATLSQPSPCVNGLNLADRF